MEGTQLLRCAAQRETTETVGGVKTTVATGYEHRPSQWLLALPDWPTVTSTTAAGAGSTVRRTELDVDHRGRIERVMFEPLGSPVFFVPGSDGLTIAQVSVDQDSGERSTQYRASARWARRRAGW